MTAFAQPRSGLGNFSISTQKMQFELSKRGNTYENEKLDQNGPASLPIDGVQTQDQEDGASDQGDKASSDKGHQAIGANGAQMIAPHSGSQNEKLQKAQSVQSVAFLYYRKLLKINLAVLHCLYASGTWVGEQLPAGAQIA